MLRRVKVTVVVTTAIAAQFPTQRSVWARHAMGRHHLHRRRWAATATMDVVVAVPVPSGVIGMSWNVRIYGSRQPSPSQECTALHCTALHCYDGEWGVPSTHLGEAERGGRKGKQGQVVVVRVVLLRTVTVIPLQTGTGLRLRGRLPRMDLPHPSLANRSRRHHHSRAAEQRWVIMVMVLASWSGVHYAWPVDTARCDFPGFCYRSLRPLPSSLVPLPRLPFSNTDGQK